MSLFKRNAQAVSAASELFVARDGDIIIVKDAKLRAFKVTDANGLVEVSVTTL